MRVVSARGAPLVLLLGGVLSACGSAGCAGDAGPVAIDCAWLQGQNCWKATVSAVAACAPTGMGAFSANPAGCKYPSGETVTFSAPATLSGPPYNFSIGSCVTVEESDAQETIVHVSSRAGHAKLEHKAASLEVTCPDGSLNIADLSPTSPLARCNRAEALLPDANSVFDSYNGPSGSFYSFHFRGAEGPPGSFSMTVWECR